MKSEVENWLLAAMGQLGGHSLPVAVLLRWQSSWNAPNPFSSPLAAASQ
jgi:hypothetical protein